MGLQMKESLQSLCCSNGWSFAVVWRLKCRDSIAFLSITNNVFIRGPSQFIWDALLHDNRWLLIPVDAYYEAESGMVVEHVLHQVHVVGEGIIGQVALTGKYRWIFSDTYCGELNPVGLLDNQVFFQDTAEWNIQFSAGVKTIAIISVSSQRVVQFGSNQKIPESLEFVDHIRSSFHQLQSVLGTSLYGNSEKSIDSETYDPCGMFASLVSSGNSYSNYANAKPLHNDSCNRLTDKAQCSKNLTQPSNHLTSAMYHSSLQPHALAVPIVSGSTCATKATTFMKNSSHLMNHYAGAGAGADAQVILSTCTMPLPQSSSSSANSSVICNSSTSTWTSGLSTYEFMEQQLLSGIGIQCSSNTFPTDSHINVPSGNKFSDFQRASFANGSLNTVNHAVGNTGCGESNLLNSQSASSLFHITESELSTSTDTFLRELKPNNGLEFPYFNSVNHLNQSSFLPLEQVSIGFSAPPSNDLLQLVSSLTFGLGGSDVSNSTSVNDLCSSVPNTVACSGDSLGTVSDGKQCTLNIPIQLPAGNHLLDGFGLDRRHREGQKCWANIIFPGGSGDCSNLSTGVSECISTLDAGSLTGREKGFFSDRGLEQLLDAVIGNVNSGTNPNSSDQSSTTTLTKEGSSYVHSNQIPLVGLSCLNGGMDALLPKGQSAYGSQKDALSKSLVSSWIDSSNNISTESAVILQPKKPEDPSKITRKRARPGESTRPRPKDRQQIQDRVKELRDIVPNSAKCSIDALLDRTIKHMLFLQSVTKYADKLKQAGEPKMIGDVSGVDNSSGTGGGATWAFEVGGQTMVCPIVVEDLTPPGQKLVEMLCEERGFFLEIADGIRGFGLNILKGVMEVREDKIWARFVVEANRNVTRMDIFAFLANFLQKTAAPSISSSNQLTKVINSGIPVFAKYQQSPMPLPISLAESLQ